MIRSQWWRLAREDNDGRLSFHHFTAVLDFDQVREVVRDAGTGDAMTFDAWKRAVAEAYPDATPDEPDRPMPYLVPDRKVPPIPGVTG